MRKNNKLVYYVSPMSYNNIAKYDYCLLSNINDLQVVYFSNELYTEGELNHNRKVLYRYSS